jgi:nucleoside-diphosphate-sugar epimerase
MQSDYYQPLNLGQDRMVSINQLADIIADIADYPIEKMHIPGPEGVRGRNSDNTQLRKILKWEPEISLEKGLEKTYAWIEMLVKEKIASASDKKMAIEELKTSRIFNSSCK